MPVGHAPTARRRCHQPDWWCCLQSRHQSGRPNAGSADQDGGGSMTRRKLVVKGRGQDARVTITVEVCRGKVWVTSFDCPFNSEAILEPGQADSLIDLIAQAAKEARSYKP